MRPFYSLALISVLALSGCATFKNLSTQEESAGEAGTLKIAALLRFEDIPVPAGFEALEKETFFFEDRGQRFGQLTFSGTAGKEELVDFYQEKMSLAGWDYVSQVDYDRILLNFEKEDEDCVVSIGEEGRRAVLIISILPHSETTSYAL